MVAKPSFGTESAQAEAWAREALNLLARPMDFIDPLHLADAKSLPLDWTTFAAVASIAVLMSFLVWSSRAYERLQLRRHLTKQNLEATIVRHPWPDPPRSVLKGKESDLWDRWFLLRFPDGAMKWAKFRRKFRSEPQLTVFDS